MRTPLLAAVAALALVACQPPASETPAPQPQTPQPEITACNDVAPDVTRMVAVSDPVAAAASGGLRGGPIEQGTYDLITATRIGNATGWTGERAASLNVTEDANGAVTFNWASVGPNGATPDRWTASFTDTPVTRITYTCGRTGSVAGEFGVDDSSLRLRLPDGGAGQLELALQRRG